MVSSHVFMLWNVMMSGERRRSQSQNVGCRRRMLRNVFVERFVDVRAVSRVELVLLFLRDGNSLERNDERCERFLDRLGGSS